MRATLYLDLPSLEQLRASGRWDRLKQLLSSEPAPTSERITLSTLAVIEGLAVGLKNAGVDDVVRFDVDGELIIDDEKGEEGDLPFIVTQSIGAGFLDKPFSRMELHARGTIAGERVTLLAKVQAEVDKGAEELTVELVTTATVSRGGLTSRAEDIGQALSKAYGDAPWRMSGVTS